MMIVDVVRQGHSYNSNSQSWDKPDPVIMSTQTILTGEGLDNLQRQNMEMKTKLQDKKGLMRNCFIENVTQSDRAVKQYTGLPSKSIFNGLFSTVKADKMKYW
jgi:hypothetical protein